LQISRHLEGNSQLVVIKNAGHAVNLEKPKDVCRNIIGFFKEPITEASNEEKVCKLWAAPGGRTQNFQDFSIPHVQQIT
jgi:hypothetical protein